MIEYFYSFVFPFLLILLLIQSIAGLIKAVQWDWWINMVMVLVSAIIVSFPVYEFALARYMVSINANFSIPLTAVVFNSVFRNMTGIHLLDRKAVRSTWLLGLILGILLYPMSMGLTRFDPYMLGWNFSLFFLIIFAITTGLLFSRNRLGVVLIICILGYNIGLLESQNFWDYLIDPFLVVISFFVLSWISLKRMTQRIFGGPVDKDQ